MKNDRRNGTTKLRKKSECSEQRKPTNTWEYWKWTPSNKCRWKEKLKKEYFRRTKKLLKTKLHGGNLIKGINTWAVHLVRYFGPCLKWMREKLKQMDQRTRKLMRKALYSRGDIDKLYVSRKVGGRRFASIEDNVDALIQWLKDYIKKCRGRLITSSSSSCHATSTDIPDPLSPLLPIIHRLRQVFRVTSCVLT